MVTVVYADVLLLINFCVDFICLCCAGRLCCVPTKAWRVVLGAAFGAFYVLFTLWFSFWMLHLVAGFVVCVISFSCRPKNMAKLYICFILFSSLLGGIFTAVYNVTASSDGLIFAFPVAAAVSFAFMFAGRKKTAVKQAVVHITDGENEYKLTALADSGCLLCDPISGDPVIIVKRSALPEDFCIEKKKYFHALPATGIGQAVLFAFRPECVRVGGVLPGQRSAERRAVVAVDESGGTFAGCLAIVPSALV